MFSDHHVCAPDAIGHGDLLSQLREFNELITVEHTCSSARCAVNAVAQGHLVVSLQ